MTLEERMAREFRKTGRPRVDIDKYELVRELRSSGLTYRDIERETGVSKSVCWEICNTYADQENEREDSNE